MKSSIADAPLSKDVTLAEMPLKQQIDDIFAAQQAHRQFVAQTTAKERIHKLRELLAAVYDSRIQIQKSLYADFKKPAPEVDLTETYVVIAEIKHAIKHLKKWMKPRRVKPTLALLTTRGWIRYEPRGVILIISPWNFPFNLTLGPLVSAVAAGNCCIIKPSEYTPNTSALIREMIVKIFPKEEVAMFEGGPEVATELLKKPFDHIFFTGNPKVGKIVMKAAAENLTSVTLELGGKSPVIIDESANINDAAKKIAWGKFMNKGQTCIAPDYLFVHESKYSEFLQKLKDQIKSFYGESESERGESHIYPRIINRQHHQRLAKMIHDSVEKGAHVEIGGTLNEADKYISPTVLSGIHPDSAVMQEEIFGPVLPVIKYQTLEETAELINTKEKPLALYIFSRNRKNINFMLSHIIAGGTCINDVVLHFLHLNLPFGGINNSGHGNSHGYYGFKTFSHERAVLKHSNLSPLKLMFPPYTKLGKKFIDITLKYL